jgi:RNA polymerase sigma-B factor
MHGARALASARDELVARYCAERTLERRNEVVLAYVNLAARAARKFKRAHNASADLNQVATIGLIKAAAGYREDMNTPFAAYAWVMVIGELMHYVRDREPLVRLPRSLASLQKRCVHASADFAAAHQREATANDVAAQLGVSSDLVSQLLALHASERAVNAGEDRDQLQLLVDPRRGPEIEESIDLGIAIQALPDREREIVVGSYEHGLTQAELADRLSLSQSHVSKLLRRALATLARRVA